MFDLEALQYRNLLDIFCAIEALYNTLFCEYFGTTSEHIEVFSKTGVSMKSKDN
jgi:hypothetical protein